MTKVNFREYGVSGKKQGVCSECGQKASRSKKFTQTYNPFNKNGKGEIKSISEILEECMQRVSKWKKEPVFHSKCKVNNS